MKDPASIQSDRPVPPETPFYYFEVSIVKGLERDEVETGKEPHKVYIGYAEQYSNNACFPGLL